MQKLLKLLYSVLLGILVVIVTKLFLDSQEYGDLARHTDTLLNQSLLTVINNIRGDISLRENDINNKEASFFAALSKSTREDNNKRRKNTRPEIDIR